jgi:hypothetical protein
MKWSFPGQILTILGGSLALAAYPLSTYASRDVIIGVAAGAGLGTINIALGYASIQYGLGKSMTKFTGALIGGMGVRLLVVLGLLGLLLGLLDLHAAALTASLFYFYVVFLILEILYIQKKLLARSSDVHTRG